MKIKSVISKILTNKILLNVVFLLALFNIIGYVITGNIEAVMYFIVLGILVGYFSKNMIIVLGVPLILVNMFVLKDISFNTKKENFENNSADGSGNNTQPNVISNINKTSPPSQQSSLPITPTVDSSNTPTDEPFEVGRAKKRSGYDIDYASTVEDAYDELNNIIGGEGIKKLTQDTQGLMKQQLQLAEAMKGMGPLIKGMAPLMKQAQGLLGGMKESGGLENITNMAKKLTGSL